MNDLIAKRYVKALIQDRNSSSIEYICEELNVISQAFHSEKFVSIIYSSEIKTTEKVNLILSFLKKPKKELENLLKLLGTNKRLNLIPDLVKELDAQISNMNNSHLGTVYTNTKLTKKHLSSIEKQFSEKFEVNLSFSQNVCDYDGIKVDIDSLGIEISFSKDRLKTQMIDHILKAV